MKERAASWGEDSPTPAQLKEFFDQVKEGRITRESLQNYLEKPVTHHGCISAVPTPLVDDWRAFCKKHLGYYVKMPRKQPFSNEPVLVNLLIPEGLTIPQVISLLGPQYNGGINIAFNSTFCISATDVEKAIVSNERDSKQSYFISTPNTLEMPDPYLRNISAGEIWDGGMKTMTLLERLWFDYVIYTRTGKHLDANDGPEWTQCSGTRLRDGFVPMVCGCRDRLSISDTHREKGCSRGDKNWTIYGELFNITSRHVELL